MMRRAPQMLRLVSTGIIFTWLGLAPTVPTAAVAVADATAPSDGRDSPAAAFSPSLAMLFAAPNSQPSIPAGEDLDELMHLLAQRRHGRVEFIEQQFLAVLHRPIESSGELRYDAPDRLEKRTLLPHAEIGPCEVTV